jgi:hypothetical protein
MAGARLLYHVAETRAAGPLGCSEGVTLPIMSSGGLQAVSTEMLPHGGGRP